jgi:protein-tyrosine kinase
MNRMIDRPKEPSSAQTPAKDHSRAFGNILIEQGRLSPADAEEIQRYASANGLRFGDAGLLLNMLTQQDIDFAVAKQFNYPVLQQGGEGGVDNDVIAAYMPQDVSIESLRALRSQLTHRWFNEAGHKTLAIVSPGRQEGRSWLAANLATVFAQMGERTLLIDADMRHPRQHELFNLNNSVGLSALLTGRGGRDIARRIHPQLRLFVLPAGILPPNPQELLGRPIFDLVLERFTEQFEVIIIDTPPAAEVADAHIIANRAGAALMLARLNVTRCAELTSAMEGVAQTGVTVVGSVLTDF